MHKFKALLIDNRGVNCALLIADFQVWDAGKRVLRLIQEVREHTKAVTCLYIPSSGDKLYSGSLDKTIRVSLIIQLSFSC